MNEIITIGDSETNELFNDIKNLIEQSKSKVYKTINNEIVKYTLPASNQTVFSSEFRLTIPSEKEFIDVIENEKKNMKLV